MNAKITNVTRLPSSCTITVLLTNQGDGKQTLRLVLSLEDYMQTEGLYKGAQPDEAMLSRLTTYHNHYEACRRAASILEAGDNSERALYRKLRQRGITEEAAKHALSHALKQGWLDEERQLRYMIAKLAHDKLWGVLRLVPYLVNRGYSSAKVHRITAELVESGELDFTEIKRRLFDCEAPKTRADWQKALYKHGFTQ